MDLNDIIKTAMAKAKEQIKNTNIIIAGKTGVGKSTLINTVFQGNIATTGSGKPVTQNIKDYTKENLPITLIDTKGLEIKDYKAIVQELEQYITTRNRDTNPENHVHIAWLCIDEGSRRVEQAEIDLCNMLYDKGIPVVVVITKAIHDNGFRSEVKQILHNARNAVRVNSVEIETEDYTIKVRGHEELVELSMELLPEAQRNAFAAAQKVSISQKVNRAHKIVATAAAGAGGAAIVPLPFADAATIVPIQVAMLASISMTFGLKTDKAMLSTLVSSTITGIGATIVGRTVASNLLKLIPGAGSILGGLISASTATLITTTFGEAYIATLAYLTKEKSLQDITTQDIVEVFKKTLSRKKSK